MPTLYYKGIDVSRYQGTIDFSQVKNVGGMDFVIIQAGGSSGGYYQSPTFETYYADALESGIYIGFYYYAGSNFTSATEGERCAQHFQSLIDGKHVDFPVFVDIEETSPSDKQGATAAAIAFCEYMQTLGYTAGVYGSDISTFQERLEYASLQGRDIEFWVAKYGSTPPTYVTDYSIWQYSGNGRVAGVENAVDLDYCYKDYIVTPEPPQSKLTWSKSTDNTGFRGWNKEFDLTRISKQAKQNVDNIIGMLGHREGFESVLSDYYIPEWSNATIAALLGVIDIRSGFNIWRWYGYDEVPYTSEYDKYTPSRYGLLGFEPSYEEYVDIADAVVGYAPSLNEIRLYTWTETITVIDPQTGLPVEKEVTHTEAETVFIGEESDGTAQTAWIGEGTRWIRYDGLKFTDFIRQNKDPAKLVRDIVKHLVHAEISVSELSSMMWAARFWYYYITGRKWVTFPVYMMVKYF